MLLLFVGLGALLYRPHGHDDPAIVGLAMAFAVVAAEMLRGVPSGNDR